MTTNTQTQTTTTVNFDDTVQTFGQRLAEKGANADSVQKDTELAVEVFGPFYDGLVGALQQHAAHIETLEAELAELKLQTQNAASASSSIPVAPALPDGPLSAATTNAPKSPKAPKEKVVADDTASLAFPDLAWVLRHRNGKAGRLTGHNIYVKWHNAKYLCQPAKDAWAAADKKSFEALAMQYKNYMAGVAQVASFPTAPQFPQQFAPQFIAPQFAPQALQPPLQPIVQQPIPSQFLGADGKLLQATSAYGYWLSKTMRGNGQPMKAGRWAAVPPAEKAIIQQEFEQLKAFRIPVRA